MAIRRVDGVLHQEVDGVVVLITAAGDEIIDLNPTGSVVWQAIGDGAEVDDLVTAVCAAFPETSPEVVTADVAAFVDELRSAGLVDG